MQTFFVKAFGDILTVCICIGVDPCNMTKETRNVSTQPET